MWATGSSEAEAQMYRLIGTWFAGVGLCMTCLKAGDSGVRREANAV